MKSKIKISLILCLTLLTHLVTARSINRNQLDFEVNPRSLNNIEYGLKFISYKHAIPSIVKDFDVEAFHAEKNMLVFSKSAFVVNIPTDSINTDDFFAPERVAKVFDGQFLQENGRGNWNFSMKISIKKIKFRLRVGLIQNIEEQHLGSRYLFASEQFDRDYVPAFYVVQILDQFSEGIKSMVIISKFIPMEEKTLVISYHLSALDYKWYKKFNIFNMVKKIYAKRILATLERTKQLLR